MELTRWPTPMRRLATTPESQRLELSSAYTAAMGHPWPGSAPWTSPSTTALTATESDPSNIHYDHTGIYNSIVMTTTAIA